MIKVIYKLLWVIIMTKEETMAVFLNVGWAVFNLKLSCKGSMSRFREGRTQTHNEKGVIFIDRQNTGRNCPNNRRTGRPRAKLENR